MTDSMDMMLKERSCDRLVEEQAIGLGFTPLQARVIAGRLHGVPSLRLRSLIKPSPNELDGPQELPDIDKASGHIADAILARTIIALVTDHDADGATSHAILKHALVAMGYPAGCILSFLSHRMSEGYGVSDALVDRMLPQLPPGTCIITADQGSTDEVRISRLVAAGHSVVVTDHHGIPEEGPPQSAHAVVNPVRRDSKFPDKAIAGCHTALLVMAATREVLIDRGALAKDSPRVSDLLDYSAVGTIADASSLAYSLNNRMIVQHGLRLMNSKSRPCWKAMRRLLNKDGDWSAADIAFQIATRINARGRLTDAMLGVEFLCATTEEEAFHLLQELDANNRERKEIEAALRSIAEPLAKSSIRDGRLGLCLWLGERSHAGVHGITATRMVEKFGAPTICLSPLAGDESLATGSIRTTPRVNVLQTLTLIKQRWPGLLLSAGGHRGAGGLRVKRDDIPALSDAWDTCVKEVYGEELPLPYLLVDGLLETPGLDHVRELSALEPYGREFEQPIFTGTWRVNDMRLIGDGTHLKLRLSNNATTIDAVWFGANKEGAPPVSVGVTAKFAYCLDAQSYRGNTRLQLIIRGVDLR